MARSFEVFRTPWYPFGGLRSILRVRTNLIEAFSIRSANDVDRHAFNLNILPEIPLSTPLIAGSERTQFPTK